MTSRPSGSGWFRAYEIYSEEGALLSQLTQDEKSSSWAQEETRFQIEVSALMDKAVWAIDMLSLSWPSLSCAKLLHLSLSSLPPQVVKVTPARGREATRLGGKRR